MRRTPVKSLRCRNSGEPAGGYLRQRKTEGRLPQTQHRKKREAGAVNVGGISHAAKRAAAPPPRPRRCRRRRGAWRAPPPIPGPIHPYSTDGRRAPACFSAGAGGGPPAGRIPRPLGPWGRGRSYGSLPGYTAPCPPVPAGRCSCAARQKAAQLPAVLWSVRATTSRPAQGAHGGQVGGVMSSLPQGERQECRCRS